MSQMEGIRPYRSHKFPACALCRRRKIRCIVTEEGQSCTLCRNQDVQCTRTGEISSSHRENSASGAQSSKPRPRVASERSRGLGRRRTPAGRPRRISTDTSTAIRQLASSNIGVTDSVEGEDQTSGTHLDNQSSFIVGPVNAEDIRIVAQHVTNQSPSDLRNHNRFDTLLDTPKDPVLYLQLPRHRRGLLPLKQEPGRSQREIMEQILGPVKNELIRLYFDHVHPCFPVLDEENFTSLHTSPNDTISSSLLCDVYAITLVYWNYSEVPRAHHRPDIHYAWNLAVMALQEEYLAPSMSTLSASLLDLAGRPTTALLGNTINCGRSVALANSLGLNRNPATWRLNGHEKTMRIRLWWGTMIHDHWSSFAHGVPGNISRHQYNVPIPSVEKLLTQGKDDIKRRDAAKCFVALCDLTEILGELLPLVYDVQRESTQIDRVLRKLEVTLDDWEESEEVSYVLAKERSVPGASSLRIGLLAVRMLMRRIGLFAVTRAVESPLPIAEQHARILLCRAAKSLADHLCTLETPQLQEFWLPYTAYHIASAVIILLRAIVDGDNYHDIGSCRPTVIRLREWLKWAKSKDWDLADLCLTQFGQYLEQMEPSEDGMETGDPVEGEQPDRSREESFGMTGPIFEVRDWASELGYPFADLWDMFPWNEGVGT